MRFISDNMCMTSITQGRRLDTGGPSVEQGIHGWTRWSTTDEPIAVATIRGVNAYSALGTVVTPLSAEDARHGWSIDPLNVLLECPDDLRPALNERSDDHVDHL